MSAPRYAQGGYVSGTPGLARLHPGECLLRPTDDDSRPGYTRVEVCRATDGVLLHSMWISNAPLDGLR